MEIIGNPFLSQSLPLLYLLCWFRISHILYWLKLNFSLQIDWNCVCGEFEFDFFFQLKRQAGTSFITTMCQYLLSSERCLQCKLCIQNKEPKNRLCKFVEKRLMEKYGLQPIYKLPPLAVSIQYFRCTMCVCALVRACVSALYLWIVKSVQQTSRTEKKLPMINYAMSESNVQQCAIEINDRVFHARR